MRTNLDKWNDLQDALKKRDQEFINSVVGANLPEVFYTIDHAMNTPDFYRVGVNTVTHAHYWHRKAVIWLNGRGKRPTTKAVEALRAYVEGNIAYKEEDIGIHWTQNRGSGSISWPDFVARKNIYTDLAEATAVVETKRAQHIMETAQLEAGTHIRCMYCWAVRKVDDITYARIWSPNWRATGGQSPPRPYCKDKGCAGYDQMGHEG